MFDCFKAKNILVTGGAGFIGSHLVDRLLQLGAARIVVLDNLLTGKRENIASHLGDAHFVFREGDANNRQTLEAVFQEFKPDYVFHLAALVGVKRVEEQPLEVLKDIDGLRVIFELSKKYNVKKVLFSSSSEAYGEPEHLPEREDGPINPNPRDPYALVKLLGENLCHFYWHKYQMPTVALRFFNVYGPRQEGSGYGFVVSIFLNQVLHNQNPNIFGDGTATRDFVFYKDNIECLLRAMAKTETNGETVNIGKGQPTTILDLAQKIIAISVKNLKPVFLPPRKLEIKYRSPDTTKMEKLLDYKAQTSLDEGLQETYQALVKKQILPSEMTRVSQTLP